MKSLADVFEIFRREFSSIQGKFAVHDLALNLAAKASDPALNRPGVYVYWKDPYGVIKVGKHQTNARVRALEHLRDNTMNDRLQMSMLTGDPLCHLLLFTVQRNEDIHWLLSLEAFLEWNLEPAIPSGRTG